MKNLLKSSFFVYYIPDHYYDFFRKKVQFFLKNRNFGVQTTIRWKMLDVGDVGCCQGRKTTLEYAFSNESNEN